METRRCSSSSSSSLSKDQDSDSYYKVVEFTCSACLFCVCCPLCIACCCIKLPCKICWKAAKFACRNYRICCGSKKKVYASYSSFSDIDSHSLPKLKAHELQCRRSSPS
ncbi:hypothetical protein MANES_01G015000v8 [Manihot esculenta]|uniref:Uncharacterized protein n=1 Tax=Manihot esculenta TaxID=3983 RepID=A0A2C9WI92_MANES|nr:hypothetical protein MANES_01G015000v8 [Manihot esculenta]